ncbi:MAG TPA: hypothetical protein VHR47_13705 [Bacillota bacterium]|jgi:hypothetical protein|nr:hypothetical protein [Bacillota bacterium]
MENFQPKVIENRYFVELEEEDIQRLNRIEADKFDHNPEIPTMMAEVEEELGPNGEWEEHWLAVDPSGRRLYARIYYTDDKAAALTADAQVIKEIDYPKMKGKPVPQTVV